MRTSLLVRGSWLLLGTAILLATAPFGQSQGQLASKDELVKAYNSSDTRLRALFNGAEEAEKGDEKHATVAAQWFLYRVTIKAYHTPPISPTGPNGLEKLQKEFHDKVADFMDRRQDQRKRDRFRKMFGVALVTAMGEVLARDIKADPATVMRASEMLSTMAMLKQDDVNNYLCELAKNGQNPVVQMHALKALREVMPVPMQPDVDDIVKMPDFVKAKWRDVRTVDALRGFIEKPIKATGMSPEEVKAIQYIRREAIMSLAQAKTPAVAALPKKKAAGAPEAPVAYTLLSVLAGNVEPPPSLSEKIEAALGVCAMKYPNMPDYDPQLGIYLVGRTVEEFVKDFDKDLLAISAVGAGKKVPHIAYRVECRRLQAGLKDLVANTQGPPAKAAKALEGAAGAPVLGKMTDKESYKRPEQEKLNDLSNLIPQLRPKTGVIFRTLKIDEIKIQNKIQNQPMN